MVKNTMSDGKYYKCSCFCFSKICIFHSKLVKLNIVRIDKSDLSKDILSLKVGLNPFKPSIP